MITIKLEHREGPTLHKRWLNRLPAGMSPNTRLTISEQGRAVPEVVISTDDPRVPLDSHAVQFHDGVSEYYLDGGTYSEAVALAEQVLERGAAAYEEA